MNEWFLAVVALVFFVGFFTAIVTAIYKDITPMERVSCTFDAENNEMDCTRITHTIEKFSMPVTD